MTGSRCLHVDCGDLRVNAQPWCIRTNVEAKPSVPACVATLRDRDAAIGPQVPLVLPVDSFALPPSTRSAFASRLLSLNFATSEDRSIGRRSISRSSVQYRFSLSRKKLLHKKHISSSAPLLLSRSPSPSPSPFPYGDGK